MSAFASAGLAVSAGAALVFVRTGVAAAVSIATACISDVASWQVAAACISDGTDGSMAAACAAWTSILFNLPPAPPSPGISKERFGGKVAGKARDKRDA